MAPKLFKFDEQAFESAPSCTINSSEKFGYVRLFHRSSSRVLVAARWQLRLVVDT